MNMKRWLAGALILMVALIAYFFHKPGAPGVTAPAPAASGSPRAMPVEAEIVKSEALAREVIAVGSLRSDESVVISPEIAGRVVRLGFEEGRHVAKGSLLFELDGAIARAELDQVRGAALLASRNYERALDLFKRKLISASERDQLAATRDIQQASLRLAEARLAKTRILAPFAGIAGLRQISPGDYVNPGQALVNLEALDLMKVDFKLSEAALTAVAVGQPLKLEVDAFPGRSFAGEVYAIDPRLSEENRAVAVRAHVPNPDGALRSGLFARVRLSISQKAEAILVAEQAILPQGDRLNVYVIEDGKAALREVGIGQRLGGRVEIITGLKTGDTVITAGQQKIGPGAPVMPINLAPGATVPPSLPVGAGN